jgi:tripartite-type tricarboxylate transporter receptor subunit TctC
LEFQFRNLFIVLKERGMQSSMASTGNTKVDASKTVDKLPPELDGGQPTKGLATSSGTALSSSMEYIKAGKLRALAVTTAARSEALPGVPTVGDFVPGYEASVWNGVGAPKNTPAEVVERLNKEINATLSDPKIKARFADLGGMALAGSSTDFGKFMADETAKWGKVIRAANIKPE